MRSEFWDTQSGGKYLNITINKTIILFCDWFEKGIYLIILKNSFLLNKNSYSVHLKNLFCKRVYKSCEHRMKTYLVCSIALFLIDASCVAIRFCFRTSSRSFAFSARFYVFYALILTFVDSCCLYFTVHSLYYLLNIFKSK